MLSALTYPQRLAGIIVFSGLCFFGQVVSKLARAPHCQQLQATFLKDTNVVANVIQYTI